MLRHNSCAERRIHSGAQRGGLGVRRSTPRISEGAGSMIVGERIRRPDAPDKVKGSALYIEDLAFTGSLWGAVLRSPHAHARVARLDVTRARTVAGVHAVLTAKDIPGKNLIPMIQADWPVLAAEFV